MTQLSLSAVGVQDGATTILSGVTCTIGAGERWGLIGRNGSGKSTLLQILARAIFPTEGAAEIRGRLAPLLAMGAGFNPEFTGRENIALSGVMLGLSRAEIRERTAEIVTFADIGTFIDAPVKRYSSGMYIRLAFSVAAHADAEIILADEVLAVGDAQFQERCMERMSKLVADGSTLVFVSHNQATVRRMCPRAIYLAGGRIRVDATTDEALAAYNCDLAEDASRT